ncbi:MAG: 4-(cytidine 5'-diphospho)-2-C-methyl-D-erythritol kinase [Elusimicrobia bacterium RIFOXYA2_FULL_58_8]|nr:MAG: 4-(cytidine 5'-diphospho)-2-C-methyl-D-erythritol kinase [Elusimicrobia bacterium RIFOXYA2_FULL_58_8]OGS13960.1 MAG: 4-(cytidine 5'-diphospho)-2-C-methyl-D-erythritol kinase [Elusimicrobia bacterium RIFOXYA12_FULL_57_11]
MVKIKAPAKINIFLEVTGKRPDGYHDLATVFARVGVGDELSLRRSVAPGIKLVLKGCAGLGLGKLSDNLVYKAAESFFKAFPVASGVHITLRKLLPVGAGLGGGSSDAASTLLGLCRLYGISRKANAEKLRRIAAGLGSDVPFFLLESRMAAATGRGEKLKVLRPRGKMPFVVVVYPGKPVYTEEAFGCLRLAPKPAIKRRLADFRGIIKHIENGNFPGVRGLLFNRLETVVLPLHKEVRLVKARLERAGADAVLMSGSGSAVFALAWKAGQARRIAAAAGCNSSYTVFLAKFC